MRHGSVLRGLGAGVLALFVGAGSAAAVPIVLASELVRYDAVGDGTPTDLSIDLITFDVEAGTTVTFDVLAAEDISTGPDLNGDGELTTMNALLLLIDADDQLVAVSDENFAELGDDGSISGIDPWLQFVFAAGGTYRAAVGETNFTVAQALAGFDQDEALPLAQDHVDWQLTLTANGGEISNLSLRTQAVPEPAPWALAGPAAGWAARRWRRR